MDSLRLSALMPKQQLIARFGLSELPSNVQEEFLKKALDLIDKRIKIRLLETLRDDELDAFRDVSETGNERQIAEWLAKNVPKMGEWLEEEIVWVRKVVLRQAQDDSNS